MESEAYEMPPAHLLQESETSEKKYVARRFSAHARPRLHQL